MVRLTLSVEGAAWPVACEPEVGDLRSFAAARGGRLLVEPEGAILVELPAYVRTSEVHPVTGAGTVLIVDDDESTLAMMSAVLRRAGFRVLSAENGVAASVLLRDHLPEIVAIVTDAVLPGRSGMELAEEARRYQPQVPVLLVSAHPTDLLGDADLVDVPLLSKPFGANALTDRVRRLVELAGEAD
jgi:CheY-like chemotaxis protein